MASNNKPRKPSLSHETAEGRHYKQGIQYKSGSLEPSQTNKANKTGEQTNQPQAVSQIVDDTPENFLICLEYCGTCPSLPFPPEPLLFCARGCSSEAVSKKSCNCPACPIYKKYRLQSLYFCETGKAVEREEKRKHKHHERD